MKTRLLPILTLGILAATAAPRADAGIDVDFRLELGWRAEYYHDFDAAVVLYEYSNYRGRRLVLYPGEQLDDFYDYEWGFRVRSVEVLGPVHVVLFDESGLWGHQLNVHHSIADLGDYRMRLNDYSTFRWHRRARSAYVSFNAPNFSVSIGIGPRLYPRIYCAHPIIPRYYDAWHHRHYHYPRPRWHYNTHRRYVPVPPPNVRPYRPGHTGPGVSPPPRHTPNPPNMGRPPSRPPNTTPPPGRPPGRPGGLGTPPSTNPTRVSPGDRPPSAPPGRVESRSQPPGAPPARVDNRNRPTAAPPARVDNRDRPRSPQTQTPRNNPGQPPAAQPPRNNNTPRKAPPAAQPPRRESKPPPSNHRTVRSAPPPAPRAAPPARSAPPRVAPPRSTPPRSAAPPRRSSPPRSSPPPPPR